MAKKKLIDLLDLSEFKKKMLNLVPTKTSQLTNDSGYKTTDTTYSVVSKTANGLAPKLPNETATTKYLRQDGTWQVPPNTIYGAATQSTNGLMTAADKKKLDGIATGANKTTSTTSLAVTEKGVSVLDGTVGKVLNDKGAQISVYKGDDGKLHFRDWSGADTAIPFNTFGLIGSFVLNGSIVTPGEIIFSIEKKYKTLYITVTNIQNYSNGALNVYGDDLLLGTILDFNEHTYDVSNYNVIKLITLYKGGSGAQNLNADYIIL